jgi:hypothetical protein
MARRKPRVVEKDHGWARLKRELPEAEGAHVKIGLPTKVGKQPKRVESKDGTAAKVDKKLTLALVGWWNEFGTRDKEGNQLIPPRSFLRSTHDENLRKVKRMKRILILKILDGRMTIKEALDIIGIYMVGQVQAKINNLRTPPNAESTKRQKGSDNPLVDIGQLKQAITHEVVVPKRKVLPKAQRGRDAVK